MEYYTKTHPHRLTPRFYSSENYRGDGAITSSSSTYKTGNTSTYTDSVTLGKNPSWRAQIARGEDATTYLSGRRYSEFEWVPFSVDARYKAKPGPTSAWGRRVFGMIYENDMVFPSAASVDSISMDEANEAAKSEFLKHLINAQRSFQGMVAGGELLETLRMLRNPARGLRKAVDSWHKRAIKLRKRGNRPFPGTTRAQRAKNLTRTLADTWLEQAFGWSPLIHDIDDAGKAINNLIRYSVREYVSGKAERQNVDSISRSSIGLTYSNAERCLMKVQTCSVRYFGAIKPEYANPTGFATRLFGFTAEDFVPTLWELTPWSFLIDYFVNIGEVLNGLSWGHTGLKWSYRTVRKDYRHIITYNPVPMSNTEIVTSAVGKLVMGTSTVVRDSYGGSFTPKIRFEVPGMGDARKWINMAALGRMRLLERSFRLS